MFTKVNSDRERLCEILRRHVPETIHPLTDDELVKGTFINYEKERLSALIDPNE
jgi:hypothetical protein